jgi:hypothetical protein
MVEGVLAVVSESRERPPGSIAWKKLTMSTDESMERAAEAPPALKARVAGLNRPPAPLI